MTLDERVAIASEAAKLEAAGADWELKHVVAVLGCAKSTVYNTPWLLRIAKRVGVRGRRWSPAEVRTAQADEKGRRDRSPVFAGSNRRNARRKTA